MKEQNRQKAMQAFEAKDFKTAADIWINGYCLPEEKKQLEKIYMQCKNYLAAGEESADLYALLGFIYLDYSSYFTDDGEDAFMQVISWSKSGIALDPENYLCYRHAGSALYWLNDEENAKKYYEKALQFSQSPTLVIRLFKIEHEENENRTANFTKLVFRWDGTSAMEYYNAGVELNGIINDFYGITDDDLTYLSNLKRQSYEKAYQLYEDTLVNETGNPLNADGHTFAMCCNNLAVEYIATEEYEKIIMYCSVGMKFSYFLYIIQNRLFAYNALGKLKEAHDDALQIIHDFNDQIGLDLYFHLVVCICKYLEIQAPEEVLKWANVALESYHSLPDDAHEKTDTGIIANYGRLLALKSNAQQKSGIIETAKSDEEAIDKALMDTPTDPLLIINRALVFNNEGNYEKEIACYDAAIHYATLEKNNRLLKTAFFNKAHTLIVHYQDYNQALHLYLQIEQLGLGDFWTYYWMAYCCYCLQHNQDCIEYIDKTFLKLPGQPNVTTDIVAQLHQYKGTSLMELKQYKEAIESYKVSLQYEDNKVVRKNIAALEEKISGGGNFLSRFFKG